MIVPTSGGLCGTLGVPAGAVPLWVSLHQLQRRERGSFISLHPHSHEFLLGSPVWVNSTFPLRPISSSRSFLLPFITLLPFCSIYSTKGSREAVPQLFHD